MFRSGGGRAGETYPLRGERITIGRHPDASIFLDDVTVSRDHAVVLREGEGWVIVDEGSLNGTYVNRRRGDRTVLGDGDEIQIGKYKLTSSCRNGLGVSDPAELLFDVGGEKLLTIGSVVERLHGEFPDISVSKLRYLEEQGLVTPRRTKSGYRLYSRTTSGDFRACSPCSATSTCHSRSSGASSSAARRAPARARQGLRKTIWWRGGGARVHRRGGAADDRGRSTLLAELEEYELVHARQVSGVRRYGETDTGIVGAAAQLAQLGLRPKNLRVLKSAVDRELGLLEQVLLPALRSNRLERRREGLGRLDDIVQATTQLRQLLFTRGVRRLTGGRDAH